MDACYCIGPQAGASACPCRLREQGMSVIPIEKQHVGGFVFNTNAAPRTGWICPKCNESNAPFMPACGHCKKEPT